MLLLKDNKHDSTIPPGSETGLLVLHSNLCHTPAASWCLKSQVLMGKNHKEITGTNSTLNLPIHRSIPLIAAPLTQHSQTAQHWDKALHVGSGEKTQHRTLPPLPGLNLSFLAIHHLQLQGTVLETELNSENEGRLKRADQQESAGEGSRRHMLNSPRQRKGPEQSGRP